MTTDVSPLRRLLRRPLFRRWAVTNLFARLPLTMNLLALVLVGEAVTGSVATGATLAGIATGTAGVTAQWRGRMLDRTDLRRGLRRDLLTSAAAMGAILLAAATGAPVWALGVLAAAHGVASAAVLGGFRTILLECVPAEDVEPANALDAVFVEVAFVSGPAVAGGVALLVGPLGVIALQVAAFLTAAVMLGALPTRAPALGGMPAGPPPLRTRGATPVYLLVLAIGLPLGAWEASIPARLEAFGMSPASAGPLLALTALGSAVGGIIAANARDPLRRGRVTAAILLLCFGALLVPTGLAPNPLLLGVALFAVGLPIAPLNALAGLAFQRTIAAPRQAEGFSLYPAMILIGAGTGQAVAGAVLDVISARDLILLLAAVPVALAVVVAAVVVRRRMAGLPPGVGFGHDPTIADPYGYADAAPVPTTSS